MPAENVTPEPLTMAQEHEDRLRTYAEIGMAFRYDEVRAILAELGHTAVRYYIRLKNGKPTFSRPYRN